MFLITRAFENQQYTWKPICWYKCSNKVVNFQLTLSVIGRKQILTWPLSKLIQFTVILFQSNFENTMCTIHLCKSWNPKFLTHATKSLHRHCIYEMIWWFGGKKKKKKRKKQKTNSKDIQGNLHLSTKSVNGRKVDSAPDCERLAQLWLLVHQVAGREMPQVGDALHFGNLPQEQNKVIFPHLLLNPRQFRGLRRQEKRVLTCLEQRHGSQVSHSCVNSWQLWAPEERCQVTRLHGPLSTLQDLPPVEGLGT